jgi:integral membrane protein
MLNTPIRRLRFVGFVEGVSYLVLLFIAMPLKYWAGMPLAVRVVGMLHGVLFILFFAAVAEVHLRPRRPLVSRGPRVGHSLRHVRVRPLAATSRIPRRKDGRRRVR